MEAADLREFIEFEERAVVRRTVFESERLWTQVLSLDVNARYGPVSDPESDAVLTVVAGEAALQVDKGRKRLKQWGSALVPAGAQLVISNASSDPLVVLLVAAPPPVPRPLSG
ncbi:MAG TPA: hypothetical protein VHL78_10555 [Actinomycetota bacterium]|nr:hypothetical protein [Actinomycetota bacterium]